MTSHTVAHENTHLHNRQEIWCDQKLKCYTAFTDSTRPSLYYVVTYAIRSSPKLECAHNSQSVNSSGHLADIRKTSRTKWKSEARCWHRCGNYLSHTAASPCTAALIFRFTQIAYFVHRAHQAYTERCWKLSTNNKLIYCFVALLRQTFLSYIRKYMLQRPVKLFHTMTPYNLVWKFTTLILCLCYLVIIVLRLEHYSQLWIKISVSRFWTFSFTSVLQMSPIICPSRS